MNNFGAKIVKKAPQITNSALNLILFWPKLVPDAKHLSDNGKTLRDRE
jgi:hypothetical protein